MIDPIRLLHAEAAFWKREGGDYFDEHRSGLTSTQLGLHDVLLADDQWRRDHPVEMTGEQGGDLAALLARLEYEYTGRYTDAQTVFRHCQSIILANPNSRTKVPDQSQLSPPNVTKSQTKRHAARNDMPMENNSPGFDVGAVGNSSTADVLSAAPKPDLIEADVPGYYPPVGDKLTPTARGWLHVGPDAADRAEMNTHHTGWIEKIKIEKDDIVTITQHSSDPTQFTVKVDKPMPGKYPEPSVPHQPRDGDNMLKQEPNSMPEHIFAFIGYRPDIHGWSSVHYADNSTDVEYIRADIVDAMVAKIKQPDVPHDVLIDKSKFYISDEPNLATIMYDEDLAYGATTKDGSTNWIFDYNWSLKQLRQVVAHREWRERQQAAATPELTRKMIDAACAAYQAYGKPKDRLQETLVFTDNMKAAISAALAAMSKGGV